MRLVVEVRIPTQQTEPVVSGISGAALQALQAGVIVAECRE